jgi:putative membrane protein
MQFIIRIIISTLAIILVAYILPGVHVASITTAIIVACALAFLNTLVKPLLILLTLPITIITLGLFLLVINALIILITDRLIEGFDVSNFWIALLFSIILSVVTSVFESLAGERK